MQFNGKDLSSIFNPSYCVLRIYLENQGIPQSDSDPLNNLIIQHSKNHRKNHLLSLGKHLDLGEGSLELRAENTLLAIEDKEQVIYQPILSTKTLIDSTEVEIFAGADFFILEEDEYFIRDCKMVKTIKDEHLRIKQQITLCAWVFEQNFKKIPLKLQIFTKSNQLETVAYDGGVNALNTLEAMIQTRKLKNPPYSPVGASKCAGCGFHDHCWSNATEKRDVSLVYDIDQSLAIALHKKNIKTYEQINSTFTEIELGEFVKDSGIRVGKKAKSILLHSRAMIENNEILIQTPDIPILDNYVMFDLEGIPPNLAPEEMIYLWGIQVYGKNKGEFLPSVASFEENGDKLAWEDFLQKANVIFNEHGNIPFVHWAPYERTKLNLYIDRYGDSDGIAERIKRNLLDLLPITRNSIAIPREGYGLKVIEKYIGFTRKLQDVGGNWAIVQYFEAKENNDKARREQIIKEILLYNQEDLDATWAVLEWLRSKTNS